jgi:hypothetical protein
VPSSNGCDDAVWVFGPDERSGACVGLGYQAVDGALKVMPLRFGCEAVKGLGASVPGSAQRRGRRLLPGMGWNEARTNPRASMREDEFLPARMRAPR